MMSDEVGVLKTYHDGESTVEEAAHAITRPISDSPVPDFSHEYYPGEVKVCRLWDLFTDALVDWPSSRTPDLIALLAAILKIPDPIHLGQVLDYGGSDKPALWCDVFGLFHMTWYDGQWEEPEDIAARSQDAASWKHERALYVRKQDIEAQLVAAGLFKGRFVLIYFMKTLETQPSQPDRRMEMTFRVPAAACWMKRHGAGIHADLFENGSKVAQASGMHFLQPAERWSLWKDRFSEVAKDGPDDFTRHEAEAALGYMQTATTY